MGKLIIRVLIAFLLGVLLSSLNIHGNNEVLQTLFTVLGIVFSISMSLLVSFNLSKIRNPEVRKLLRHEISVTRNRLLSDFVVSTTFLVIALLWKDGGQSYSIAATVKLNIATIATVIIVVSLLYEIYNFRKLHSLNSEIEDEIIKEESAQ